MTDKILYEGKWENADLCKYCGEYLSDSVVRSHWMKPCHNCGAVGRCCPDYITTSRKFICTSYKRNWYGKKVYYGYYVWSGKSSKGVCLDGIYVKNRNINTTPMIIMSAGIASGLF